jgi:cytochrome c553
MTRQGKGRWATALGGIGLGMGMGAGPAEALDPIAYGKHLSSECTTCHRLDGQDKGIPSITGWPVEEFVATLNFYRNNQRHNPVMQSVARSLDEEQMRALAAYFASLSSESHKRTAQ